MGYKLLPNVIISEIHSQFVYLTAGETHPSSHTSRIRFSLKTEKVNYQKADRVEPTEKILHLPIVYLWNRFWITDFQLILKRRGYKLIFILNNIGISKTGVCKNDFSGGQTTSTSDFECQKFSPFCNFSKLLSPRGER